MIELGIVGIAILALIWLAFQRDPKFDMPETQPIKPSALKCYEAVDSLFVNAAERKCFEVLHDEFSSSHHVFAKVRLEDIIRVKRSIKDPQLVWGLRGRVKSRHVDYLITDIKGVPKIAIELDGTSHRSVEAKRIDEIKNGLMNAAGVKLCRIKVGQNYRIFASDLRRMIK